MYIHMNVSNFQFLLLFTDAVTQATQGMYCEITFVSSINAAGVIISVKFQKIADLHVPLAYGVGLFFGKIVISRVDLNMRF